MAHRKVAKPKKRINSRAKGARGELEVAAYLRTHGYEARRGQQFSGGGDSPDVVHSIPGIHLEVKFTERADIYGWLEQAKRDAKNGNTPVVIHKRNRRPLVAILDLDDYLNTILTRSL